jgi:hypothetical protein
MATAILAKKRIWSDQELEALPKDGYKYELSPARMMCSPATKLYPGLSVV